MDLGKGGKMTAACIRIRILEDELPLVRTWIANLVRRSEEVLESMRQEGVSVESIFLDEHPTAIYLVWYLRSNDLASAFRIAQQSQLPIDLYHRSEIERFVKDRNPMELLADFNSTEGPRA
ncbi:MAG: DUF6176 family protein [Chlamydiia bacterium]